jgi:hypothetical protein
LGSRLCAGNREATAAISASASRLDRVDETFVKVRGEWRYLYRAIDKDGAPVDFLPTAKRDLDAAKRFFRGSRRKPLSFRQYELVIRGDTESITLPSMDDCRLLSRTEQFTRIYFERRVDALGVHCLCDRFSVMRLFWSAFHR